MRIHPFLILLYVYLGSSPMLMPLFVENLALTQPFPDSIYIGFSIFGLSCMTLVLGRGIQKDKLNLKSESWLRFITQSPQLVILLMFLGRVEPEKYPFDYLLMISAYCLAVTSLIWTGNITKHQHVTALPSSENDNHFTLRPNIEFIRALLSVAFSAIVTWFLLWAFNEEVSLLNTFGVFGVVLAVSTHFENKLSNSSHEKTNNAINSDS